MVHVHCTVGVNSLKNKEFYKEKWACYLVALQQAWFHSGLESFPVADMNLGQLVLIFKKSHLHLSILMQAASGQYKSPKTSFYKLSRWNRTTFSMLILYHKQHQHPKGSEGDTPDFKWRGWLNDSKNQNPEIPTTTKKSLDQKLTPKKSHAEFPALKNFQKVLNDTCITWLKLIVVLYLVELYSQNYAARTRGWTTTKL